METMIEDRYWQAVLEHDTGANGAFVYAVRSTGIYCRPSCPSRRPKREEVQFYAQPEAAEKAEQAGFRPCKRCQPRLSQQGQNDPQVTLVQRACRYIEEHLEDAPNLAELGAQVNLSPFHLQRVFKRVMGITPRQYAEAYRLGQLKEQLKEGESVTQAMYEVGFSSSSRLYERAPVQLGMTPTIYRRGGLGMSITYTIVDSALGRLLVAATEKGICSVCIGSDDAPLEAALLREYPKAEIRRETGDGVGGEDGLQGSCTPGSRPWWSISTASNLTSTCPSMCRPRPSSGASGKNCRPSPTARLAPTARSPRLSASPRLPAPWLAPAPPTRSPSSSPAIASCVKTGISAAIAGGLNASSNCWSRRHRTQLPPPPLPRATARVARTKIRLRTYPSRSSL